MNNRTCWVMQFVLILMFLVGAGVTSSAQTQANNQAAKAAQSRPAAKMRNTTKEQRLAAAARNADRKAKARRAAHAPQQGVK